MLLCPLPCLPRGMRVAVCSLTAKHGVQRGERLLDAASKRRRARAGARVTRASKWQVLWSFFYRQTPERGLTTGKAVMIVSSS